MDQAAELLRVVARCAGGSVAHVRAIVSVYERDGSVEWVVEVFSALSPEKLGSRKGSWSMEGRGSTLGEACAVACERIEAERAAGLFRMVKR